MSVGTYNLYKIKKELLEQTDNITDINLNDTHLLKKYDYDLLWIYGGFSILEDTLKDNKVEQKRLEKNIEKLESLKYLKNNGDMFYLISHLKINATKEIILLISYSILILNFLMLVL